MRLRSQRVSSKDVQKFIHIALPALYHGHIGENQFSRLLITTSHMHVLKIALIRYSLCGQYERQRPAEELVVSFILPKKQHKRKKYKLRLFIVYLFVDTPHGGLTEHHLCYSSVTHGVRTGYSLTKTYNIQRENNRKWLLIFELGKLLLIFLDVYERALLGNFYAKIFRINHSRLKMNWTLAQSLGIINVWASYISYVHCITRNLDWP